MTKLTKDKVKKAIDNCLGNYSLIAQRCGVQRSTITEFFKRNPNLKELADMDRDKLVDLAESKLPSKIEQGDSFIIWKVISTKGKNRGWAEKPDTEINLVKQENIQISINIPDSVKRLLEEDEQLKLNR